MWCPTHLLQAGQCQGHVSSQHLWDSSLPSAQQAEVLESALWWKPSGDDRMEMMSKYPSSLAFHVRSHEGACSRLALGGAQQHEAAVAPMIPWFTPAIVCLPAPDSLPLSPARALHASRTNCCHFGPCLQLCLWANLTQDKFYIPSALGCWRVHSSYLTLYSFLCILLFSVNKASYGMKSSKGFGNSLDEIIL